MSSQAGALTPGGATPLGTPAMGMKTPAAPVAMTPEQMKNFLWEKELDDRNRALSDEELDALFPPGYKVGQLADLVLILVRFSDYRNIVISITFADFATSRWLHASSNSDT